jgi:hypothetical protein
LTPLPKHPVPKLPEHLDWEFLRGCSEVKYLPAAHRQQAITELQDLAVRILSPEDAQAAWLRAQLAEQVLSPGTPTNCECGPAAKADATSCHSGNDKADAGFDYRDKVPLFGGVGVSRKGQPL